MIFYDTNALLKLQEKAFESPFIISSVTLEELDNIKSSHAKDEQLKYMARHVTELLKNFINSYQVILYRPEFQPQGVEVTPDVKICSCAKQVEAEFVTDDVLCYLIAKLVFGLEAKRLTEANDDYCGYVSKYFNDDELAEFYQNPSNNLGLRTNEYIIVNDGVDIRKWNGTEFVQLNEKIGKTNMFGTVKARDIYQRMLIDSFNTNQITMVKGPAGTGKTYLALAYYMWLLEKHLIDKIIIFCNPVAAAYQAKLGFYPGSKDDKLMDSTIGNILKSKFGDSYEVQRLIENRQLELLALADLRGFDTSGMRAGVLIEEAENLDISLMKLALQRIGADSKCIVDGDYNAQVDMAKYAGDNNGMRRMSTVFRGHSCYGEIELKNIYRSEIAQIAEAM